jgi:fermentation-respiration switch protein FrsA (DUF1100 family)
MIFPGRSTQGQRHAVVPPSHSGDYELVTLSAASGTKIVAVFGKAMSRDGTVRPDASLRPTILLFYGNGMCLADAMGWLREFRLLGANVMIPDYAGYGMSGGEPSEKSLYETADACWEHLAGRSDIDQSKIIPTGVSIGGAVAIDLAARRPAYALATFSAFTSMPDMARDLFPWLPTSLLLKHRLESEAKIRQIKVPTFIAHGTNDQIIPFWMSERLRKAAGGPVTYVTVETDHNDLFELAGDELLEALGRFIESMDAGR